MGNSFSKAIKFVEAGPYLLAHLTVADRPAGYAKVKVSGEKAELIDIMIHPRLIESSIWRWLYFWHPLRRQLRGRGFGTLLLNSVCAKLKEHGVRAIHGTMAGDVHRLQRWYARAGFIVDRPRRRIELRIQH